MQDKLKEVDYLTKKLMFKKLCNKELFKQISIDELHNSNTIEGNTLTYGDTLALLNSDLNNLGVYKESEIAEILAYKDALEFMVSSLETTELTVDFIADLHYTLMSNLNPAYAGYIRQYSSDIVKLSNSDTRLVRGDVVPGFLDETVETFLYDIQFDHALVAVTRFKLRFIHCHPFFDGNGRISRLLTNFLLLKLGMYPTIIKASDRDIYFSALHDAIMENNETIFMEWFIENYITNLNYYISFV